jgi:repressor LexA
MLGVGSLSGKASILPNVDITAIMGMINLDILSGGGPMTSTAEDGPPGRREPGLSTTLSSRQRQIVRAIRDSVIDRGCSPSVQEIGDVVGLTSRSAVWRQLRLLEDKGVLRLGPGRRAIQLWPPWRPTVSAAGDVVLVPLIGRIAAGHPILAEENIEDLIPLPSWLVPRTGEMFMLKVIGDSMIGAAIADGDLVLVRSQQVADNRDIVAAMIDGEATVKTLQLATGHAWLMPHNLAYTPIPGDDAVIVGKVISVLRMVEQ